jgi:thiosulfate/3-mercaptopyruvate sulfurtransferase
MSSPLISVADLQARVATRHAFVLFDTSFDLMDPLKGPQGYAEVHIAGARYANLNEVLSAHSAEEAVNGGRHPLPQREIFAAWLGSQGVRNDTEVVVYDRNGVNYAGRLWWMLRWCGHRNVRVLDGGLQAWMAAGGATASGTAPAAEPATYELQAALADLRLTAEVVASLGRPTQTILDARATPRFKGEVEPMDPVAGHIPGALNRPFGTNIGPDGLFKPAAQLRAEFETLLAGRDPATVVHHCGSGVSAVPNILAMEIAGLGRTALYAGSWSEWCNTPGMPCAKG